MQETLQPLLSKAQVNDLLFNVARSGLSMGDTAWLILAEEGRVAVCASVKTQFLFWMRSKNKILGYLTDMDSAVVLPNLRANDALRVRIVGLTPEHLAPEGKAVLHVSVWGHRQYTPRPARTKPQLAEKAAKPHPLLTTPPLQKKSG